jgi:hypothetical protein
VVLQIFGGGEERLGRGRGRHLDMGGLIRRTKCIQSMAWRFKGGLASELGSVFEPSPEVPRLLICISIGADEEASGEQHA